MQGQIEQDGKRFDWWAGKASPAVESKFCVHCWCGDYGVTRYYDYQPERNEAEITARELIPVVRELN